MIDNTYKLIYYANPIFCRHYTSEIKRYAWGYFVCMELFITNWRLNQHAYIGGYRNVTKGDLIGYHV